MNTTESIDSVKFKLGIDQELQMNSGEILWIKGPSGCGKTTLLDHLMYEQKIFVNQKLTYLTNYSNRLSYANHAISLLEGSLRKFTL